MLFSKFFKPRCKDDKERRERYLASHKKYGLKDYRCDVCNITICQAEKARHEKNKKHLNNLKNNKTD